MASSPPLFVSSGLSDDGDAPDFGPGSPGDPRFENESRFLERITAIKAACSDGYSSIRELIKVFEEAQQRQGKQFRSSVSLSFNTENGLTLEDILSLFYVDKPGSWQDDIDAYLTDRVMDFLMEAEGNPPGAYFAPTVPLQLFLSHELGSVSERIATLRDKIGAVIWRRQYPATL